MAVNLKEIIELGSMNKQIEIQNQSLDIQLETGKVGLETAKAVGKFQIDLLNQMNDEQVISLTKTATLLKQWQSIRESLIGMSLETTDVDSQIKQLMLSFKK